jgi:hypothetical protein
VCLDKHDFLRVLGMGSVRRAFGRLLRQLGGAEIGSSLFLPLSSPSKLIRYSIQFRTRSSSAASSTTRFTTRTRCSTSVGSPASTRSAARFSKTTPCPTSASSSGRAPTDSKSALSSPTRQSSRPRAPTFRPVRSYSLCCFVGKADWTLCSLHFGRRQATRIIRH